MHDEIKILFLQYLPIPDTMKNVPGRMSSAQNQYLFQASLPALGYSTYYFEAKGIFVIADAKKNEQKKVTTTINQACVLENEVEYEF
jgi:hypothetical protein